MKKKPIIIFAGAIVIILAIIFAVIGGRDNVSTVSSDDGVATLEIPKGALPDGTTLDDIKITKAEDRDGGIIAYNLEPDGLKLNEPVNVSLAYSSGAEGGIPLLIHEYGDESEVITNTTVDIFVQKGEARVSGDIDHFSTIHTSKHDYDLFNYKILSGGSGVIGQSFPFELKIWVNDAWKEKKIYRSIKATKYRVAPGTTWKVKPLTVFLTPDWIVKPHWFSTEGGDFKGSENFKVSKQQQCVKEGNAKYDDFKVKVEYRMVEKYPTYDGGEKERYYDDKTNIYIHEAYNIDCEEEEMMGFVCQMYMIDCGRGGVVVSGNYKCDPATGENILNENGQLVDSVTGRPPGEQCPNI